jgi:tRNA-2-methylthio-N6-dimethylallyladenosine synthase
MNKADSERMGSAMEQLGLQETEKAKDADVIVLNSCVVRQNAEDRVVGMLTSLKPWRESNPDKTLALMGCMVGPQQDQLKRRFPYVDTFMRPQQFQPLIDFLGQKHGLDTDGCVGTFVPTHPDVTAFVPIIHGCNKFCTFCIIPYRRGREVSRPLDELVNECSMLSDRGVRAVTVLGQNVDSYGHDLPGSPDLGDLLEAIHNRVPALSRIRFLTSHPNDMSSHIIDSVATLPRVMKNINLPFQAGDDTVLENMRRGYTNQQYRDLAAKIRRTIPNVALVTDLIVGFPGESREQFKRSLEMITDLRFDKVHVAAYSPRPNTFADRKLEDTVSQEEKQWRLRTIEAAQESILTEINAGYLGTVQEVLVESRKKGIWQGRTQTDKLVLLKASDGEQDCDLQGQMLDINITDSSPWALKGHRIPSN